MAKSKAGKRTQLESFTIGGTNKVVRVGDSVTLRAEAGKAPYIGKVKRIELCKNGSTNVNVQWYYRPEDSKGGRRQFHGSKELFLSDHYDDESPETVEGICYVHSFKNYTKLESVGPDDYYCRFDYNSHTGAFIPDRVAVYCKCEMPYNPDDLMVQCEGCKDWFHPACLGMTVGQTKQMAMFMCTDCATDVKKDESLPDPKNEESSPGLPTTPTRGGQIEAPTKRLKKEEKKEEVP